MGYDLVVLDATGRRRLGAVELSPDEQAAIAQVAVTKGLAVLSSFPGYWDGESQIPVQQLRPLLAELSRAEGLPTLAQDARSAIRKIRGIADVALAQARPLEVVPD